MRCQDLMKRRVRTIAPSASVADAARLMASAGVGFLPVVEEGRAVGVVTDLDITVRVCAQGLPPESTAVESIMSTELVTCLADEPLSAAEQRMVTERKWRILVVDRDGNFSGVVSLVDIAHIASPFQAAVVLRQLADRDYRLEVGGQVPL